MAKLEVKYCGLKLKNPIVVSSSTLTDSIEKIKKMKNAGAIVLRSLMQEEIDFEINETEDYSMLSGNMEMYSYIEHYVESNKISKYLEFIQDAKSSVDIPIIASINCVSHGSWIKHVDKIENAGADALELNIFNMPLDENITSEEIENNYFKIVKDVRDRLKIPLIIKIGNYFTNILNIAKRLSDCKVDGIVMFNKFFLSDINIKTKKLIPFNPLSTKDEFLKSLRWISLASKKSDLDFALSGGVYETTDVIKAIMAGSNTVYLCSVLYEKGIGFIDDIVRELNNYLDKNGISDINNSRRLISEKDDDLFERFQFLKINNK